MKPPYSLATWHGTTIIDGDRCGVCDGVTTANAKLIVAALNREAALAAALAAMLVRHDAGREDISDLWPKEAAAAREALGLPPRDA